ncbi:hypothetical protein CBOM_07347 [Ceraceosorus bombacis]|uniref:Uncharacterized protein n=1 Tax=Ceraceosorus bombacis TaxID=401625 RepID=A0A0P1B7Q6_9BASI|nr:hypothetical protein CBOM_07347 [Ceraceosorus bombacis]
MAISHGLAAQDTLYLRRPSSPIISRVRGLFKSKPSPPYDKLDSLPLMHRMSDSFREEASHHAQAKAASERSAKVKKKFTIWRGQFTRKSAAGAVSGLFGTVSAANAIGALWEKLTEPAQMSGQRYRKSSIPSERRSFGPARLKVINARSKALRPRALETGEVLSFLDDYGKMTASTVALVGSSGGLYYSANEHARAVRNAEALEAAQRTRALAPARTSTISANLAPAAIPQVSHFASSP